VRDGVSRRQQQAFSQRSTRPLVRSAAAGAADPESFADQYAALVEGTLVLRQVHGRDDAARIIRPAVERLISESINGLTG
jgi:hypothetical protein